MLSVALVSLGSVGSEEAEWRLLKLAVRLLASGTEVKDTKEENIISDESWQ